MSATIWTNGIGLTIHRLVELCRYVSTKYTRQKVRSLMPADYEQIIDELVHLAGEGGFRQDQYENIINTTVQIGQAADVIQAISQLIKRLVVDRLHIVGDIFDRGPRADIVMDSLIEAQNVDIQWGNHDVLWMGAASGSRTLVATVLSNSIRYNNLDVIETGYGISLRPLSIFANEVYRDCNTEQFKVKLTGTDADQYTEKDKLLSARMYKAITIILFKLEGQKILRRPEFGMADRLLLDKINYEKKTVMVDGVEYPMTDCDFPTVDPADPYTLTDEESHVITQLTESFVHSEKLQKHTRFLYSKGGLYKISNGNLLFHGCIPYGRRREAAFLHHWRQGALRPGIPGLCGENRPEGLLRQAGQRGAAVRAGLFVVAVGRTEQPHLWPGPDDHLRAPVYRRRKDWAEPKKRLLHLLPGPGGVRNAAGGVRIGWQALSHHQRPCAGEGPQG